MLPEQRKAYIILHICVFIWGFTAILGNLISLKETVLVWYRMGITSMSLMVLPTLWQGLKKIPRKEFYKLAGIGILVALHWITFYGSIKYSLVSVALTCLATISLFTAFLEPLLLKTPFQFRQVMLAAAIIPAIYMLFYFTGQYNTGIILGLLSSFFAALFTVFNKKMMETHEAVSVTFIELSCGFLFMSVLLIAYLPMFPETRLQPTFWDTVYLFVLSIFCTSIPFILSLTALRHLSAFTTNLTVNLEPVYGILMASFLFRDHKILNIGFYSGAVIIILVVLLDALLARYAGKATPGKE